MFLGKLEDRRNALMDRTALPIAVFVRLYLLKVGVSVDRLVHPVPVYEHTAPVAGGTIAQTGAVRNPAATSCRNAPQL
jgi:hypothetical protein